MSRTAQNNTKREKKGGEEKENEVFVSSPYHNSIARLRKISQDSHDLRKIKKKKAQALKQKLCVLFE